MKKKLATRSSGGTVQDDDVVDVVVDDVDLVVFDDVVDVVQVVSRRPDDNGSRRLQEGHGLSFCHSSLFLYRALKKYFFAPTTKQNGSPKEQKSKKVGHDQ